MASTTTGSLTPPPSTTTKQSSLSKLKTSAKQTWKKWKPLLAAKQDLDDEYNFTTGRRRGVNYEQRPVGEEDGRGSSS